MVMNTQIFSTYLTGNEAFDSEHHRMFCILNEIELCVSDTNDQAEINRLMSKFHDIVFQHFTHEEELMQRHKYPTELYEAHMEEHHQALHHLDDAISLSKCSPELIPAIISALYHEIDAHIRLQDNRLGTWLKGKI